ncbi:type II secretion system protein [Candidatus Dependentiae bacterium]|nr:type II secretion system protein [Candidatus Dependentiae bacterium]
MSIFNFNLKSHKSQSSGFILLEIMVALIVLITLSMALGGWYSSALTARMRSDRKAQALILASACIEQCRAQGTIVQKNIPDYFKLHWRLVPDAVLSHFATLTVSVRWSKSEGIELITGIVTS